MAFTITKRKYITFLYAFLKPFTISIIGKLILSEILAFLMLPTIKFRKLLKVVPKLGFVIVCLSLLLLAQVISDLVNISEAENFIRGWALIIFGGISTIFLVNQFVGEEKNVVFFLLGTFLTFLIFGEGNLDLMQQAEDTNYFKFRIVTFLNAAVLLASFLLMKKKYHKYVIYLFVGYSILCFFMDARSNGLSFLIASLLVSIKFFKVKITRSRILWLVGFFAVILYSMYVFYVDQVLNHGFGGKNAFNQLSRASNPYNPLDLIYYGRTEIFILIEAIKDKPIFGHGSWAPDPGLKYAKLLQTFSGSNTLVDLGFIKAHSVVLGFWAYTGLLGLFSIVALYWQVFKQVIYLFKSPIVLNTFPIVIFCSIEAIWHFLFSPIQELRLSFPFFVAIVLSSSFKSNTIQQIQIK